MSSIDGIMLELAESGKTWIFHDMGVSLDAVREAAAEDGVQVRFTPAPGHGRLRATVVTLRKVGLGH